MRWDDARGERGSRGIFTRLTSPNRIARVIFFVNEGTMVLLHGFIKKAQLTPKDDLELAVRRKRDVE